MSLSKSLVIGVDVAGRDGEKLMICPSLQSSDQPQLSHQQNSSQVGVGSGHEVKA
jgi:hypothetical protein